MARLEITFFTAGNRSREGGTLPVPHTEDMLTEVMTVSGTSSPTTSTSQAQAGTGFVRLYADTDLWVVAGAAPVATVPGPGGTADGMRLVAGQPLDLAVPGGARIAAITA